MKPGDYVVVVSGVHDDAMPPNRRDGLIVELLGQHGRDQDPDQVLIMFSNCAFLKFHISQIKVINESR
jgi:hypothetical protein